MVPVTLTQLADIVGGTVAGHGGDVLVTGVTIDSRSVAPGDVFVALPGEHVDGHAYAGDALARGAAAVLWAEAHGDPTVAQAVVVDDPGDALLGLGRWVRETVDPMVIALTGSSGKTTTKDLVAAAVGAGRRVVANRGSFNNELGVPLTCCELTADTEVLVAEIGARGIGHIARLAPLIAPDVAIVTTVGAAHLELLGDLGTVARAKAELVEALDGGGVAILNADDERVAAMAERAPGAVRTYGHRPGAGWRAGEVAFDELARPEFSVYRGGDEEPCARLRLPLPGAHNVGNALAALAAADIAGVPVTAAAAALERATVSQWRMQLLRTPTGVTILNDAYNANPASMAAALTTLGQVATTGRRWAVLGQMAELGPGGGDAHAEIGRRCVELGVDRLVVVGAEAAGIADAALGAGAAPEDVTRVDDVAAGAALLRAAVTPGDVVLVKASRSVGLERIADDLVDAAAGQAEG